MKWEDPPPPPSGPGSKGQFFEEIKELRSHPGEWAKLSEDISASYTAIIRKGQSGFSPPGAFQAVVRKISGTPKRGVLYVRYVGEESA